MTDPCLYVLTRTTREGERLFLATEREADAVAWVHRHTHLDGPGPVWRCPRTGESLRLCAVPRILPLHAEAR